MLKLAAKDNITADLYLYNYLYTLDTAGLSVCPPQAASHVLERPQLLTLTPN